MNKKIIALLLTIALIFPMMPTISFAADNSTSSVLIAKAVSGAKSSVKINWLKANGGATKYVVYGNRFGKESKKVATLKSEKKSYTVKKIKGKKLSKNTIYSFRVVAFKGKKAIAKSRLCTVITNNAKGKYGNPNKLGFTHSEIVLMPGEAGNINNLCGITSRIYKNKKHLGSYYGMQYSYVSTNSNIVKVNQSGIAETGNTAKAGDSADIYVQEINGLYQRISVKVGAAKQFTLRFDKNSGEASGSMTNQIFIGNTAKRITKNAFKRGGFVFAGWNTKADGTGIAYEDNASIHLNSDLILYAQWGLTEDKILLNKAKESAISEIEEAAADLAEYPGVKSELENARKSVNAATSEQAVSDRKSKAVSNIKNIIADFKNTSSKLGGRIYFIDEKATGGSFRFYKKNGEELPYDDSMPADEALNLLSKEAYWVKEIEKTENGYDKFYVYATLNDGEPDAAIIRNDGLIWGSPYYTTGVSVETVGAGKVNTNQLIELNKKREFLKYEDLDGNVTGYYDCKTIWNWVEEQRNSNLNGHNDWYVYSFDELLELIGFCTKENLVNEFYADLSSGNGADFISSSEQPYMEALEHGEPGEYAKSFSPVEIIPYSAVLKDSNRIYVFLIRSFGGDDEVITKRIKKAQNNNYMNGILAQMLEEYLINYYAAREQQTGEGETVPPANISEMINGFFKSYQDSISKIFDSIDIRNYIEQYMKDHYTFPTE